MSIASDTGLVMKGSREPSLRPSNCRNEASNVSPMTIPKMRGIVGIFALAQTKPNTPKIAVMIT